MKSPALQKSIHERTSKSTPLNIDGAAAVIFAELGFSPPLARGSFCLSRSVGAMVARRGADVIECGNCHHAKIKKVKIS